MIGASDPPPVDDIVQCPVGSSTIGRPTVVAPVAPLATAGTVVPSVVDPAPTTHPYGTWLKHNIKKFKVRIDGTVTYSMVQSSASEPTSHITAMEHLLWRQAMNDEFQTLLKNKTWYLVPPHVGLKVIDCKWVFKLKQKSDGSIDRYKACMIAKGFKQQYDVDYDDTFSPVVRPTTIQLLLSVVISRGWVIRQIDIQNALWILNVLVISTSWISHFMASNKLRVLGFLAFAPNY